MIRTEAEYREAVKRLEAERRRLLEQKKRMAKEGLTGAQLKRLLDPLRSFHLQLKEEVESYERLRRGDFGELRHLDELGRLLVALRIARGMTQRELARRLKVDESQVSRDERNEYHNITVNRAGRILEILGVDLRAKVRLESNPHSVETA